MSTLARSAPAATHEVRNQPPPLSGRDLFADNAPLVEALVGPLSPVVPQRDPSDPDVLVAALVTFCLRSVTKETH